MQLFSWMTWILSLALAGGGLVNISQTLDAQTAPITWEQKYVLVITAGWPIYIAFALALIAGIGATLELLADAPARATILPASNAPTQGIKSKKRSAGARQQPVPEQSYSSHLAQEGSLTRDFERVSKSLPHQMVNLYEEKAAHDEMDYHAAPDPLGSAATVPAASRVASTPRRPGVPAAQPQPQPTKASDDEQLEFFRM